MILIERFWLSQEHCVTDEKPETSLRGGKAGEARVEQARGEKREKNGKKSRVASKPRNSHI